MKDIVFNDMFGTVKIDAANLFSTTMKKMEETLPRVLNNRNYNYAALSIVNLVNKFISLFDEFLEEKQKLNRNINELKNTASNTLSELETIKIYGNDINKYKENLRDFTKVFPMNTDKNDFVIIIMKLSYKYKFIYLII